MKFNSGINTIKKVFTAAEMASGTTPVVIVPAPGAGLTILPIGMYIKNNVTVTWTSDATASYFSVGNTVSISVNPDIIFTSGFTGVTTPVPIDTAGTGQITTNSALSLVLDGTAATGGTGTIDVIVIYKVMPL